MLDERVLVGRFSIIQYRPDSFTDNDGKKKTYKIHEPLHNLCITYVDFFTRYEYITQIKSKYFIFLHFIITIYVAYKTE